MVVETHRMPPAKRPGSWHAANITHFKMRAKSENAST
jgi:hypothetical protein